MEPGQCLSLLFMSKFQISQKFRICPNFRYVKNFRYVQNFRYVKNFKYVKNFICVKNFRYVKEDFILTDYSSNDHTTRSVLSIKQFQKKVERMMIKADNDYAFENYQFNKIVP